MNQCNVCEGDFDIETEGGIDGYFGILPVSFCPTCYASMCDMADQASFREWEGLTDEEVNEIYEQAERKVGDHWEAGGKTMMFPTTLYQAIEAELKDRNT
jgi:hypothetical protein